MYANVRWTLTEIDMIVVFIQLHVFVLNLNFTHESFPGKSVVKTLIYDMGPPDVRI